MLSVGSNGNGTNGSSFTKGVYVNQARIISVVPYYGEPKFKGGLYPDDIGLEVKFDTGLSWHPTIRIGGKFAKTKDEVTGTETITGWGSAFVVNDFFSRLGIKGNLTDTNMIPAEWLAEAVGKTILKLDYIRGLKKKDPTKKAYGTWDQFGTVEAGEAELIKRFMKAVEKKFVKDFNPDVTPATAGEAVPSAQPF